MLDAPPTSTTPRPSSQPPQRLIERGLHDTVVQHSPYGSSRNSTYGWGTPFRVLMPATVPGHPRLHIGISSLNGVPSLGRVDRSMRYLMGQYRQKFSCLEHCNPYHNVGDVKTWQSWADMVHDSTSVSSGIGSSSRSGVGSAKTDASAVSPRILTVDASRFIYTVKANNFLTHVKQLHVDDDEVVTHIRVFFRERCLLLEPHLGPVLVQLPPSFTYSAANVQRLTGLYELLSKEQVSLCETGPSPGSPASASAAAAVDAPPQLSPPLRTQRRLRIALEFRSRTWFREETFALLRSFRWALVVAHHHDDPTFAQVVDTNAGFLYVRLHGPLGRNVGDYGPLAMKLWAEEFVEYLYPSQDHASGVSTAAAAEREVFVFLNNSDSHVAHTTSSVVDATCLAEQARRLLDGAASTTQPRTSTAVEEETAETSSSSSPPTPPPPPPPPPPPTVEMPPLTCSTLDAHPHSSCLRDPAEEDARDAPAKRPRTTSPRGSGTRDDELIIE